MSENQQVLTEDIKFLIKELYEQVFPISGRKIEYDIKEIPKINPLKGLGKNSINFLNALKKEYKGREIKLTDKKFKKLRFENNVVAISHFINSIESRGFCDVIDNNTTGMKRRIISFTFKN
jgi:hypothetical protein